MTPDLHTSTGPLSIGCALEDLPKTAKCSPRGLQAIVAPGIHTTGLKSSVSCNPGIRLAGLTQLGECWPKIFTKYGGLDHT